MAQRADAGRPQHDERENNRCGSRRIIERDQNADRHSAGEAREPKGTQPADPVPFLNEGPERFRHEHILKREDDGARNGEIYPVRPLSSRQILDLRKDVDSEHGAKEQPGKRNQVPEAALLHEALARTKHGHGDSPPVTNTAPLMGAVTISSWRDYGATSPLRQAPLALPVALLPALTFPYRALFQYHQEIRRR